MKMTIVGKCSGRRLQVTFDRDTVIVETLSGQQAGSVFTHMITELKKKPDVVVGYAPLQNLAMLGGILAGLVGLMCAGHWGEGITVIGFWICVIVVATAFVVFRSAPRRKTFLWSTTGGVQAFGVEETKKNQEVIRQFMATLEAAVTDKK